MVVVVVGSGVVVVVVVVVVVMVVVVGMVILKHPMQQIPKGFKPGHSVPQFSHESPERGLIWQQVAP